MIKERVSIAVAEAVDPLPMLINHIDKANKYVILAEKINAIRRIFRHRELEHQINILNNDDKTIYETIRRAIANISYGKQRETAEMAEGIANWIVNNYVKAAIALKPKIAINQMITFINYTENMPVKEWLGGVIDFAKDPKKHFEFMWKDEYIKNRYYSGSQNEGLKLALKNIALKKTISFSNALTWNVRFGDIFSVVVGGYPYVRYLIKQGKTQGEAFKLFREATMRSQQAATASSLSNMQNKKTNPFYRSIFAFGNTGHQYLRKMIDAVISYRHGDITGRQMAKTMFIYGVLNSYMYTFITGLSFMYLFADDGEDDREFYKDLILAPIEVPFGAVNIIGNAAEQALGIIYDEITTGKHKTFREPKGLITSDVFNHINKFIKDGGEVELEDWINGFSDLLMLGAGVNFKSAYTLGEGIIDIFRGSPLKGGLKALGYSNYRAKKITGEQ
jgi:hypothetical protein